MSDWLDRLLVALGEARVDVSAEDVADVAWLAPFLDGPRPDPEAEEVLGADEDEPEEEPEESDVDDEPAEAPAPAPAPIAAGPRPSGARAGQLHLPGGSSGVGTGGGRPLRAPTGSALPGSLALARALRPLRRRVASRSRRVLDLDETVRRVAEEGTWLPATRPARERWLDLSMVVDVGASMGPWRSMAAELLRLFASLGAFRSVRVWSLETDATPIRLVAGLGRPGSPRRDPRELVDPAGRSLIVILTDGVAESWADGQVARVAEAWARAGPVALLQVLPEHLWARSALGLAWACRLATPAPSAANSRLSGRPLDPWADPPNRQGSAFPVASLTPEALSAWARVVAGSAGAEVSGYRLDLAPGSTPVFPPGPSPTPRERLDRFWGSASPPARRLAGLLAASPAITLPLIRLVRQSLLPEGRQVHEAEVLLGGLLRVVDAPGISLDPDEVRYDFRDGVRSLLLDAVPAADALEVLGGVSAYVEEHLAHGVDFRAMLSDPAGSAGSIVLDEGPFARVAAEVLLRLGGDYARLVATLPAENSGSLSPVPPKPSAPPGRPGKAPPPEDPPALSVSPPPASRSMQHRLDRVRKPRVQISYEAVQISYEDESVMNAGAVVKRELPFVIGVLADLFGSRVRRMGELVDRGFLAIDRDNFDAVMELISPRLSFVIGTATDDPTSMNLNFRRLEDFSPDFIAARFLSTPGIDRGSTSISVPASQPGQIGDLIARGGFSYQQWRRPIPPGETLHIGRGASSLSVDWDKKISRLHAEVRRVGNTLHVRKILSARNPIFLRGQELDHFSIEPGESFIIGETVFTLSDAREYHDRNQADQLREILQHPEFRRLEATWRGLAYLVDQVETGPQLKIKVLDVSRRDLVRDLDRSVPFDKSLLFDRIYNYVFRVPDNEPFGLLIGDYEFDRSPGDVRLLGSLSSIAAAAHAPFVAAPSPAMFGLNAFPEMTDLRDLSKSFAGPDSVKWRSFRESEDARFVGLVLPRLLGRLPYGAATRPIEGFPFEEWDGPGGLEGYLWINGAWAFAVVVAGAMAEHGWPAAIRGFENGPIRGLPVHAGAEDGASRSQVGPAEMMVTDRRQFELTMAGFVTLISPKRTDHALFLSTPSCQQPRTYDDHESTLASWKTVQLDVTLCVSRFVHHLQVLCRDQPHSYDSAKECERLLNRWIMDYVLEDGEASAATRSRHPLSAARVEVQASAERPGVFRVILFITPAFQLESMTRPIRTVFEVPARGA